MAKRQKFANAEEFYAAIGYGGVLLSKIMPRIKDDFNKKVAASKAVNVVPVNNGRSKSSEGVIVEGIDNCLIKLSKCCTPLPGDEIIGFITRGHGVSIHKRDCNNVPKSIETCEEPNRWITARWDNSSVRDNFITTLQITSVDREGMIVDIMNAMYNMRVPVHSVNARALKNGNCVTVITISAESVEHLRSIIARAEKIHGVFTVERIHQ